jgi:hypothetical protein
MEATTLMRVSTRAWLRFGGASALLGAAGGKKVAHQLLKNSFQKVD